MKFFETRLDERVDFRLVAYSGNSDAYHLMHDEETEIVPQMWKHPDPHIFAVLQTGDPDALPPHPMTQRTAQAVQNDDLLLVDMRSVPLEPNKDGDIVRRFGSIPFEPHEIFLIVASNLFNHINSHGVVGFGIGDALSIGANTL